MRTAIKWLIHWFTPVWLLEPLVWHLVAIKAKLLPATDAARFMMRLNNALYPLEALAAVAYGGGIHTKHRHIGYHEFFIRRINPGETVLDIGCGIGSVAYDIANRAEAAVVGIDFNFESIQRAREHFSHPRVSYVHGDALTSIPDKRFDVLVLSSVLEHIQDREMFLGKLCELNCSSRFLIRVPLFERDWRVPLKKELGVEYRLDLTHCIEYTQENFQQEMKGAGLVVKHLESRWGEIWAEVHPTNRV